MHPKFIELSGGFSETNMHPNPMSLTHPIDYENDYEYIEVITVVLNYI